MHKITALIVSSCFAAVATVGCLGDVNFQDGNGGDDGCEEPRPSSSLLCPAVWSCIDGDWVDTGGACPDQCPVDRPADGSSCAPIGASCFYEEWWTDCGDYEDYNTVNVQCTPAGWTTMSTRCQPEPICPDEAPINGGDCSDWSDAYWCDYQVDTACGTVDASASCEWQNGSMFWRVDLQQTCDSCVQHDSDVSCSANPACRWLEPGCGEPGGLAEAGCFAADDCAAGSCDEGESCGAVTYDPCWNSSCDACAAEAQVCLPVQS